jgi:multidrug efflux pump subunit AcrA (membrane-fusion protein)
MRQMEANEPQPPSWLGYVGVDDVAATVAEITGAGGKVYMPTTVMENVEVTTGARHGTRVEVLGGLRPGDVVVTAGQLKLRDGAAVQVVRSGVQSEPPAAGGADRAG